MIHMLSKFDLKSEIDFNEFRNDYTQFVEALLHLGLIVSSGPIGKRVSDTPMDTAGAGQPEYYTIMNFKNREQLDATYEHFLGKCQSRSEEAAHRKVQSQILNPEFICWESPEVAASET